MELNQLQCKHSAGEESVVLGRGPGGVYGGGGGDAGGFSIWVMLMSSLLHEELSGVISCAAGNGGERLVGISKLSVCLKAFSEFSMACIKVNV